MDDSQAKADLLRYLQDARDALLWKLDGLSEYDIRRPMTPTGTNLLGLVKHLTAVELGYFGDTFGRPYFDEPPAWYGETAEDNADMWATAEETRAEVVALYRQAWKHSGVTISELPLSSVGHVPWWPAERREVTLHHVLVRVLADTQRHAGHADILRELSDGAVGYTAEKGNMPPGDESAWEEHRRRVESAAREAEKS